jgi:tRNA(Ile)-lysidine synthase
VWVLLSGDSVVWIIGHRIDNRFKITDKTESVYQLSLE